MRPELGRSTLCGRGRLIGMAVVLGLLLAAGCDRVPRSGDHTSEARATGLPQPADPDDPQKPLEVTVGAYINQILEINFAEDYFVIDMWLWFRWEPSADGQFAFTGGESYPLKTFEITNGQILERSGEMTETKDNDGRPFTYQNVRVIAKITQRFNMRPYPAESHALEILVEDSEERVEKVLYVADTEFSRLGAGVKLPGWDISARSAEVAVNAYPTNFGNSTLNDGGPYVSRYSQFRYVIDLEKPVLTSIVKSLWPTFLATVVAILALFLKPGSGARFDLAIGAIFAIVANKFTITSSVQDAVQFGYSDIVQVLSAGVVVLTLAESVWAVRQEEKGRAYESQIRKADIRFGAAVFAGYIIIVLALLPFYRGSDRAGGKDTDAPEQSVHKAAFLHFAWPAQGRMEPGQRFLTSPRPLIESKT